MGKDEITCVVLHTPLLLSRFPRFSWMGKKGGIKAN
jgi:hypothetical protein